MSNNPRYISIQYLKGIGPKRSKVFTGFGINTVFDLLFYFPRRYEDRTNIARINNIKIGEMQTVRLKVLSLRSHNSWHRKSFNITEALLGDDTGNLSCVWFNQPYIKSYLEPGTEVILYGKAEIYSGRLQMSNPEFEIIKDASDEELSIGKLVPVYRLPQGFSQRMIRRLVKSTLDEYIPRINDPIPYDIRQRCGLLNLAQSLINIHFPQGAELQKESYRRLSFGEFFIFQLPLVMRKMGKKKECGIIHKIEGEPLNEFINQLPFSLTKSQKTVLSELKTDLSSKYPMQRLLQGDVGSGKTVIALAAAIIASQGDFQVAFMVPTEILAKQHFDKISLQVANLKSRSIKVSLLTGTVNKDERYDLCKKIRNGKIDIVIGTHALLQEGVVFKNLGLVIIDEQHKFGVSQRLAIVQKGVNPDVLIMTATPIPRTLAITLYGDLDLSVISELPAGRPAIKTLWLTEDKVSEAYALARQEAISGRQVFIVYPVIEDSFALDISGAKKMYEELKTGYFKDFKIGLIHGKLKQEEQDRIMSKFKERSIDILVSTTILEVGIDIPNATCMIVEHAHRFGLSQLHQLRGRIGRGVSDSVCILISDAPTVEAKARMEAMVKYGSGFKIAEEDLKIRGPGEFFGKEQHGLSDLKIGDPLTQMQLLKKAREEAVKLLKSDPSLAARQNQYLKEDLLFRFPEYEKIMLVG